MYWIDKSTLGYEAMVKAGQTPFMADSTSDIANLPTMASEGVQQGNDTESNKKVKPGASCFVIATADVYVLNSEDVWAVLGG